MENSLALFGGEIMEPLKIMLRHFACEICALIIIGQYNFFQPFFILKSLTIFGFFSSLELFLFYFNEIQKVKTCFWIQKLRNNITYFALQCSPNWPTALGRFGLVMVMSVRIR